jgi:hypothetical protein
MYLMDTPGSVDKLDTVAQKSRAARPWYKPVLLLRCIKLLHNYALPTILMILGEPPHSS